MDFRLQVDQISLKSQLAWGQDLFDLYTSKHLWQVNMETWVESVFCPDKHIINITEEHLFPREDAHTVLRVLH